MKLSTTIFLLAATLAAAGPLAEPRQEAESGVAESIDPSELEFLTLDDGDSDLPVNGTEVLVDENFEEDGSIVPADDVDADGILPRDLASRGKLVGTGKLSNDNKKVQWAFKWSKSNLRGEIAVEMNKSGYTTFQTYVWSGVRWKRQYKVNCVFLDRKGRSYTDNMSKSGTIRKKRSQAHHYTWNYNQVREFWTDIEKSSLEMECYYNAGRNV